MGIFSATDRDRLIGELSETEFDVLVIGGGITGAGIALDAQTRGLKAALLEMQDFAAGTSSRSTKLIHGGLRYLKQGEVKMVAEVGRERAVVYENGPHVTTPERMLLPLYRGGTFGRFTTSLGLRLYDFLAGVKREERRTMLSRERSLEREPLLNPNGLVGGGLYVEYRTDDARLTIEVMKKAAEEGAVALNYARVERLLYEEGRVCGAEAADRIGGRRFAVRAKTVVNATGPWVDRIREMDRSKRGKTLRLTKGIHLVFDRERFPLRQAIYFDTPDKRMLFAIPRGGKTYVGTTDTDYEGDPTRPRMTVSDRDYVLHAAQIMFPALNLTERDIESSWAGLRPLIYEEGKSPSEVSRRDEIFHSESGLYTIAGGKLTGYRKMAEHVVDRLVRQLSGSGESAGRYRPCVTKRLPISGGDVGGSAAWPEFRQRTARDGVRAGLSPSEAERLADRYGSNAAELFRIAEAGGDEAERYGLPPALYAQLKYAVEREMAATPADFWIRRTGALFFEIAAVRRWKEGVADAMADWLGYSDERKAEALLELEAALRAADTPAESDSDSVGLR
ncbi:glycerol-3-phosphate dehydrogenase/oxidase [Cohnella zeiphila]|uniref:Glycerol-3-phosphate dehydrogenase n=1 Tax=Cohnella zeiphila TaxID=2761120 RepID=A0A7X0VYX4_9BACL|nr:glycerol-3-phosphate dehydrogenase/oxidase [Cohnella zeiphila]MBB6735441.1 glycerol-3-phosphate dehydrogenase/oxidase [Cohnella zeiphila]